ncbi:MAG: helix-turn-helix domain-containing protein [Pseudomonadota bacterium]
MDSIFKAMADPTRRSLLDSLRATPGQSLRDLQGQLEMSRFGVMKHLGVLEDAKLVVTHKKGRFKYHYLNTLPLQEAMDRWMEPLLEKPAARAVLDLKSQLEGKHDMTKPDFMMQTYIRCTQDTLWAALEDESSVINYHFMNVAGVREGDTIHLRFPDGTPMLTNRLIRAEPKSLMECTFEPHWEGGGAPSRVIYRIEPEGDHCKLTIEHFELTFPVVPGEGVADGWARWCAGLKSWLETGQTVRFADPEMEG